MLSYKRRKWEIAARSSFNVLLALRRASEKDYTKIVFLT